MSKSDMISNEDIPGKIIEVRKLLRELEESEFCKEHDVVEVRVWSQNCIMDMEEKLTEFNSIFNNSL